VDVFAHLLLVTAPGSRLMISNYPKPARVLKSVPQDRPWQPVDDF